MGSFEIMKRFALLEAERPQELCFKSCGGYEALFQKLLRRENEEWTFFHVEMGHFPTEIDDFDVFIITGSKHDAFTDLDWIVQLRKLIQEAVRLGKTILGYCFGHQIISTALGGDCQRAPDAIGWELGFKRIQLNPSVASRYAPVLEGRESLYILQVHRDQVYQVPPHAEVLASSARTPVEAFVIGSQVLCVQGHPEFHADIVKGIVEQSLIPEGDVSLEIAGKATESLALHDNSDALVLKALSHYFIDSR